MKTILPYIDFAAVKAAVSIAQILDRYGASEHLKGSSEFELRGPCPIHQGKSQSEFAVNLEKNCWNCFSDCKRGGNMLDFVALMEGITVHEAAVRIDDWFELGLATRRQSSPPTPSSALSASQPTRQSKAPEAPRLQTTRKKTQRIRKGESSPSAQLPAACNQPLGFALKNLDAGHPYIQERGISDEAVAEFGIGYCSKGTLGGHVVVPVHNSQSELVAYMGRWPGQPPEDKPKYRFPKGFQKGLELFNIHRALACPEDEPLILVEGIFDAIYLWECGIRRCVALMGSTLADAQARLIIETVPRGGHVEILFDEDDAGRSGRAAAAAKLVEHCYVRIIRLPEENLQPDDLDADQLTALFE
ncbi:MAG: DNA primase [Verrucomicrobiales bacterium]|jgi:DNA primase